MKNPARITLCCAIVLVASPAAATDRCVVPSGSATCASSIQAALALADPGDTIRVATGTYLGHIGIFETVTIEGGWDLDFTVRDPEARPTTIVGNDPADRVITITGSMADTSLVAPTLDGLVIRGGQSGGGVDHGGGLRINDSDAVIRNCVISDNNAYLFGGGVFVQRGAPLLEGNYIHHNTVIGAGSSCIGGGIDLENTRATLVDNVFDLNLNDCPSGHGGGIALAGGGPVVLRDNTVTFNTAAVGPTVATDAGYGGGISIQDATDVEITGNSVANNTASSAKVGYGGGVYVSGSSDLVMTGNTVADNTAGYVPTSTPYLVGGGVLIASSTGTLSDNVISDNRANRNTIFGNGGGVALVGSTVEIQGGEIRDNSVSLNCEGYGGGVYAESSTVTIDRVHIDGNCAANTPFYGLGGGLAFKASSYTLTNLLVTNNYAFGNDTAVGGISADATSVGSVVNCTVADNNGQGIRTAASITVTNSIIAGHTTGIEQKSLAGVTTNATYNNFFDNATIQRGFALDSTNIVIDPELDADFHLGADSPAIDEGTRSGAPDHDFDGEPRPSAGSSGFYRVDIGADEATGTAQLVRDLAEQAADFTVLGPGNPVDNAGSTGSNDWIGYAVAAGDIDGDGRDDLIAGAPNLSDDFDGGVNDGGRVFALFGGGTRESGVRDLLDAPADLEVRSHIHQKHIGQAFAAGDLDGDGDPELLIGAGGGDDNGTPVLSAIFDLPGGASLGGVRDLIEPTPPYRTFLSDSAFNFGMPGSLALAELDGSAPADIAVADSDSSGQTAGANAGVVYVFFGRDDLPALWDLASTPADLTIYGRATDDELGAVATGDVDGDGSPDLLARSITTLFVFRGPLSSGSIDLATASADTEVGGLSGSLLAAGDVDGDGVDDVLVGLSSAVSVIGGTALAGGGVQAVADAESTRLTDVGASALAVIDWDDDGRGEIVIGEAQANRVFVVYGRQSFPGDAPISDVADLIVEGSQPTEQLGYSLAGGDLDDDGAADLVLGSRSHTIERDDPNFDDAGAVYVLYGEAAVPTTTTTLAATTTTVIGETTTTTLTAGTTTTTVTEVTTTTVFTSATCGDANGDQQITATDALVALKTAIGTATCDLCICDTNDSAGVTASDALAILKTAVGTAVVLACPECG